MLSPPVENDFFFFFTKAVGILKAVYQSRSNDENHALKKTLSFYIYTLKRLKRPTYCETLQSLCFMLRFKVMCGGGLRRSLETGLAKDVKALVIVSLRAGRDFQKC